MTDMFSQSEFSTEEGELSPSEHFESIHSPSLGFTYIEKSLASLDAGLDEFEGEQRDEAEIYANVTVFREVMQYIEEFGIYLYSRLDPDVEFVEAITGTRPSQVKNIFESIRDGEFDSVVSEYQEGLSGDEWLKQQLGYDKLEANAEEISLDDLVDKQIELGVDTLDEAISTSLQTVTSQLMEISEFFLRFDEPYNAIKHGNRVNPLSDYSITVDGPDGQMEIEIDEMFVSFLCKTSGDRRGGALYTFTVPVRILREQAVGIVRLAKNIYTHIYDIRQKVEKSKRTGEKVSLNPNFYGVVESSGGGREFSLKSMENPDATVWLPEEVMSEGVEKYELPIQNEVAIGIYEQGGKMIIESEGDRRPSYDYPLMAQVQMQSDSDHLLGMEVSQNFSFKLYQLPLWQYLELHSLIEPQPIQDVTLKYVNTGESETRHTNEPVSLPTLPDPIFPDLLNYMRNVGLAADSEIWLPYYWPKRLPQVVEFYRQEYSLTRDLAEELLNDINELTDDVVMSIPTISILDPESADEEGNYQDIRHCELAPLLSGIILEVDEERGTGEFIKVPGSDPRYKRKEVGHIEAVGATLVEEGPEQVYEMFVEDGLDAITRLSLTDNPDEANAVLETKRDYGPKYTWYHLDKFHFALYEEIPPHMEVIVD